MPSHGDCTVAVLDFAVVILVHIKLPTVTAHFGWGYGAAVACCKTAIGHLRTKNRLKTCRTWLLLQDLLTTACAKCSLLADAGNSWCYVHGVKVEVAVY